MYKSRDGINTVIAIVTLIITRQILSSIGMENMSVQLIISTIIAAYVFFIIVMTKNIKKGLGTKTNIILITGLSLLTGLTMFAIILDKVNPAISHKYYSLFSVLLSGGFFILGCFALICRIIYERKKRNS